MKANHLIVKYIITIAVTFVFTIYVIVTYAEVPEFDPTPLAPEVLQDLERQSWTDRWEKCAWGQRGYKICTRWTREDRINYQCPFQGRHVDCWRALEDLRKVYLAKYEREAPYWCPRVQRKPDNWFRKLKARLIRQNKFCHPMFGFRYINPLG